MIKFNHKEVAIELAKLGFRKLNPEKQLSTYINDINNIVSYYVAGSVTPKGKNAYLFIYNNNRSYAYSIKEINKVYSKIKEI